MSYTGKCIYIDLSTGKHEIKDTDKALVKEYIGGKGLGFALLEKLAPKPDAFGPENPLIFVNGPFTGTKMQTSGRTTLVTKAPLTSAMHDSHCGGNFGPALKRAGFDYMVITGKSAKPVYLHVTDKKVEILDATSLWGKGIFHTNDELIAKHKGIDPRVAAIGLAGENLSFMSCIGVDKHRNFGRGGVGAVMGSKMLKAIVCDGETKIKVHDENLYEEVIKKHTRAILDHAGVKFRRVKGTMKCIRGGQQNEMLPVRNFKEVVTEHFEKISSETTRETLNWQDTSCFNCAIRCSKWARWDGHEIEGPEYETAAFLGSSCEIYDIKAIAWANEMCNDLGFDTISTGSAIAFAMECNEKGLLTNTDGLDLSWGNDKAERELIIKMAKREGIGELFTDGTKIAAKKIGKGSEDIAMNISGMELSGINPKGALTMGVAMVAADFASHTRLWIAEQEMGPEFKEEDIPNTVVDGIDGTNARNSLVVCDFVPLNLEALSEVLNSMTGYNHSSASLMKLGRKIAHLSRRYNMRNGRTHKDDTLPGRFFNEESLAGFRRGKKIDRKEFEEIIQKVFAIRGWDKEGMPTEKTMSEFGL